ncbi:MAG: putative manganese transporter [Bacteroidales bacterium]|nr:putative manganese transporter [Bacteroidales bacterium]
MYVVLEIIQKTLLVSGFVLLLMILIEYLHVRTMGNWNKGILKNKYFQILVSVVLGLTPGCAGGFAVVSLYTHQFFSFSALLAVSIATLGDEAFIIFATNPQTGIELLWILGLLAFLVSVIFIAIPIKIQSNQSVHMTIHDETCCTMKVDVSHQLRKITFQRALLLGVLFLLILNMFLLPHEHEGHAHHSLSPESIVFIGMIIITTFIIITVPEHFLSEHIWHHVLKKHFLKLFLWAMATIAFVHVLDHYMPIDTLINENIWVMLAFAILVGLLPLSGPHILFFTLYMQQLIPFAILLANSIVQEGHAGIPLLAEDKRAFVYTKLIKIIIAIVLSIILLI